jgi:xanthine dehydrogenase YagT iron-sulfur-binding subunit
MESAMEVKVQVNGRTCGLCVESRVTLLDAVRENLGLVGTKKGCDQGTCGACTVLLDGKSVLSCLTLAAQMRRPGRDHHRGARVEWGPASDAGVLPPS